MENEDTIKKIEFVIKGPKNAAESNINTIALYMAQLRALCWDNNLYNEFDTELWNDTIERIEHILNSLKIKKVSE